MHFEKDYRKLDSCSIVLSFYYLINIQHLWENTAWIAAPSTNFCTVTGVDLSHLLRKEEL